MIDLPFWVADYGGIPFADLGLDRRGCNCWGLARLVYRERCGIDLPSYAGDYAGTGRADAVDIARLVQGGLRQDGWREVDWRDPATAAANGVRWGEIRTYDGVLLRLKGYPMHMAVMVAPRWMLHTICHEESHPERLDTMLWRHRIHGFYRHESLL